MLASTHSSQQQDKETTRTENTAARPLNSKQNPPNKQARTCDDSAAHPAGGEDEGTAERGRGQQKERQALHPSVSCV